MEDRRSVRDALVALNFRVPFGFRQRMKLFATARGLTMTELLTAAVEHYFHEVTDNAPSEEISLNKE